MLWLLFNIELNEPHKATALHCLVHLQPCWRQQSQVQPFLLSQAPSWRLYRLPQYSHGCFYWPFYLSGWPLFFVCSCALSRTFSRHQYCHTSASKSQSHTFFRILAGAGSHRAISSRFRPVWLNLRVSSEQSRHFRAPHHCRASSRGRHALQRI